jgi:hypothetical protein
MWDQCGINVEEEETVEPEEPLTAYFDFELMLKILVKVYPSCEEVMINAYMSMIDEWGRKIGVQIEIDFVSVVFWKPAVEFNEYFWALLWVQSESFRFMLRNCLF